MKDLKKLLSEVILKEKYDIDPSKLLAVYDFGSTLYDCNTENSDIDLVAVVNMKKNEVLEYKSDKLDIQFISDDYMKNLIDNHHIIALECISQNTNFPLDKYKLRRSISSVVSNSYVKAKKKISQGDLYIGQKSFFHSIRILDLGIQLAETGKIDFTRIKYLNKSCSLVLSDIKSYNTFEELDSKYRSTHREMQTKFRLLCPL